MTAAGHDMILEVDEEGNVLVGGVKLMLRDKMTTNGVIHVIGKKPPGLFWSAVTVTLNSPQRTSLSSQPSGALWNI